MQLKIEELIKLLLNIMKIELLKIPDTLHKSIICLHYYISTTLICILKFFMPT